MSEVGPDAPKKRGDGCPFCAIVVGSLEQPIIYEDAWTVGFIDRRQPAEGHTLVVPRRHIRNMYDLDDDTAGHLMRAVTRVTRAVRDAFVCDGMSHWISTGPGAGQEVFHLHVHVMPRRSGDGLLRIYPSRPATPGGDELERQAAAILNALDDLP